MRNKNETQAAPGTTGTSSASRLTPGDVQSKEFGVAFRGYNERDVDEFLDRVTEDIAYYMDENRKLRSQLASSGYVDPNEWGANAEAAADDVLRKAKQEAERILREAEARAASIGSAGASDHRAIVAPYLNRERDFLQSLGGLVQEHAETIKAMVEEARRRTDVEPAPAQPPARAVASEGAPEGPEARSGSTIDEAEAASSREEPAPIVITDDAIERAASSDDAGERSFVGSAGDAARRADEDEDERRSLRELFWGGD